MKVRAFMTADPETVQSRAMLSVAREEMDRGAFCRLPVVGEAGNLLGIVTDGDLREHIGYLPTTRITAAMIEKPLTVEADAPVEAAIELMLQRKIGGPPVLERHDKLVGIMTGTDLRRALLQHPARARKH